MTEDTKQKAAEALSMVRNRIDAIDDTILDLLNERLTLGGEIGAIKRNAGLKVLDTGREQAIFDRLFARNSGPLNEQVIQHLYSAIMAATREVQRPQAIAYLGPEATNTHVAALTHFEHAGEFVPRTSISEIFSEVEKGSCQYGVVPVENSIEGAVNHTLDLLFTSGLQICGETVLSISHDLLSREPGLGEISVIYSHPQAFAQCRKWLGANLPHVRLVESASTASAAKRAAIEPGSAAIAGPQAASIYNLKTLVGGIEDRSRNTTRFLTLGKEKTRSTGNDKTTLMFVTRHVPGALVSALRPLSTGSINMVKLESRPTQMENWSYFFIVDVEGHMEDPEIASAFKEMEATTLFLKHVGSYARGEG